MENAAFLSSKIEETKENNEFAHKIGQQYHKPQNTNYRKKHYPQNQYQHQQRSTPNNNTQSHVQDVEPKVTMQKSVDEVEEKCAANVIK